jgi:hypothetical protein
VSEHEHHWGGSLWVAADLITPMAIRVAATLRVADVITSGVASGPALLSAAKWPTPVKVTRRTCGRNSRVPL